MSTMLTAIALRAGSAADLALVDSIMGDAFDPRYGEAWTRGQCLGILAMPGVWLTLAEIDGTGAGFALSRMIPGEAELLLLATRPAFRRRGVAGALLRSVIADSVTGGATLLHLEVRENNPAVAFYTREGFAKVGERRGYYRGNAGQSFSAFTFNRAIG